MGSPLVEGIFLLKNDSILVINSLVDSSSLAAVSKLVTDCDCTQEVATDEDSYTKASLALPSHQARCKASKRIGLYFMDPL